MNNLSIHSELGCILFLNADIDNQLEAGKITRVSSNFLKRFDCKSKEEVIGQNMLNFVIPDIAKSHQLFINTFIKNKTRFNNLLP